MFTTNINVLDIRQQRVPNLGCHDTETARTITHSLSMWHNNVSVVSLAKPGGSRDGNDRYIDNTKVRFRRYSRMSSVQFCKLCAESHTANVVYRAMLA